MESVVREIMFFITSLGSTTVIVILGLITFVLIWKKWSKKEARRLLLITLGGVILNNLLKIIIKRPRPLIAPLVSESSYSFPSGHAMNATIFYLLIAFYIYKFFGKKKYKWILISSLICLVLLIGFSRLYLGVHYPSDVVAGILIGVLWLVIVIKSVK